MAGWETPAFWGSPVTPEPQDLLAISADTIYVIDRRAKVLDEKAILSASDLGPLGKTWSQNTATFDGKHLFHRTAKELIAIDHISSSRPFLAASSSSCSGINTLIAAQQRFAKTPS